MDTTDEGSVLLRNVPTYLAESWLRILEVSNFRCMQTGTIVLCNITDSTDLNV